MVSIIIPVYNRAHLVGRTLQSVLEQTARPLEVVLVDNNSSDGSLGVLQVFKNRHDSSDFNVKVAQEMKPGAAAARNCGARLSTGDWLLFFDSDDTMDADMVERYMAVAQQDASIEMVLGRADVVELSGVKHELPYYKADIIANNIFHASFCPLQRCLVKRELCERVGWWNEDIRTWDDWEFTMRMLLCRPAVAYLDEEVKVHVYIQRQSITGTDFASKAGTWENAMDATEAAIKQAPQLSQGEKERLLKFLEFKRVTLSGQYIGEGRRDLAIPLFSKAYNNIRHDRVARWLYPLLRSYIAAGGRGASHVVKWLVK